MSSDELLVDGELSFELAAPEGNIHGEEVAVSLAAAGI